MSDERIEVSHRKGVVIIHPLVEEFEGEIANLVLSTLYEAIETDDSPSPKVVMDLSKVVFIDSMSLGTLVKAASDLAKLKGKFMVAGTQEPVRRTLALTRMDKLFHTFPTVDEAIEELTSTPKA